MNICTGHAELTSGCQECEIERLRKELGHQQMLRSLMRSSEVQGLLRTAREKQVELIKGNCCPLCGVPMHAADYREHWLTGYCQGMKP